MISIFSLTKPTSKLNKPWLSIAIVLGIIGSLYRFEMFLLIYVLALIGYLLNDLIVRKKSNVKFYILVLLLGTISVVIRKAEAVNRTVEQKEFVELYKCRAAFGDYFLPSKTSNRKQIEGKLEWGQNELDLIRTWSFPDFEKLRLDKLSYYVKTADKSKMWSISYLFEYSRYALNDVIFKDYRHILLLLFALCILVFSSNVRFQIVIGLFFVTLMGFLIILTVYFKIPGSQVQLPMYLFFILFTLSIVNTDERWCLIKLNLTKKIILLFAIGFIVQNHRILHNQKKSEYLLAKEVDIELNQFEGIIYSLPTNYPGYAHFSGLKSNQYNNSKIFFNSQFYNHPSNIAFNNEWKKEALLNKEKLLFYFKKAGHVQMNAFSNAFRGYVEDNYALNYKEIIHQLEHGFVLELKKEYNE